MKKNPFESSKPMWEHVKNGTIPTWLIDRLVSVGYRDPRKKYSMMNIINAVCSVVALFFIVVAASVLNTTISNRMFSRDIVNLLAPGVIVTVFFSVAAGYLYMRKVLENQAVERMRDIEEVLNHLIHAPRPSLTPADLADDESLRRAVESALTDLAARKVVFLEYEKNHTGGSLRLQVNAHMLSAVANADLGNLLDAGKKLRILSADETFTRFFAQASATRVSHIQREFDKVLASGGQFDLCW